MGIRCSSKLFASGVALMFVALVAGCASNRGFPGGGSGCHGGSCGAPAYHSPPAVGYAPATYGGVESDGGSGGGSGFGSAFGSGTR